MNKDQLLSALKDINKRLEAIEANSQGDRIHMRTQEEIDLSLAKQACVEVNITHNFEINVEVISGGDPAKARVLVTLKDEPGVSFLYLDDNGDMTHSLSQHVLTLIQRRYKSEGGKTPIVLCMQFGQS